MDQDYYVIFTGYHREHQECEPKMNDQLYLKMFYQKVLTIYHADAVNVVNQLWMIARQISYGRYSHYHSIKLVYLKM